MPNATTLMVRVDDLFTGDKIIEAPNGLGKKFVSATVARVERKQKFATITFSDRETKARWNMEDTVYVVRYVKTEDEKRADRIFDLSDGIRCAIDNNTMSKAVDILKAGIVAHECKGAYSVIDHWQMDDFLKTQAFGQFWWRVSDTADKFVLAGVDTHTARLAALHAIATQPDYPQNPLSRSTSVTSNIYDDMERYVRAYIVDRYMNRHDTDAAFYAEANAAANAFVAALA